MSGRPRDVTDEEILWELHRRTDPAFSANEIAEFVEMSRQGVHNRLEELQEKDLVTSKHPGRDRIWWITPGGAKLAEQYSETLG